MHELQLARDHAKRDPRGCLAPCESDVLRSFFKKFKSFVCLFVCFFVSLFVCLFVFLIQALSNDESRNSALLHGAKKIVIFPSLERLLCSATWHVVLPTLLTTLLVVSLSYKWNVGDREWCIGNGERRTWNGERRARVWDGKYIGRNLVVGKVRGSVTSVKSRGVLSHL